MNVTCTQKLMVKIWKWHVGMVSGALNRMLLHPWEYYDNRHNFPSRQDNNAPRFPTRYDIPSNANYGQNSRAIFNNRPRNMTYYQSNPWNTGMLALPSTQNTLNYHLNRSRNDSFRGNNTPKRGTRYANANNYQRNNCNTGGACGICGQFGHHQTQCKNLN